MKNKEILEFIDFHTHILPGMDHGCTSLEMSKRQISLAADYGCKRIVTTSHFYPHLHEIDDFLERREKAFDEVNDYAKEKGVEITRGAEVQICVGLDKMPDVEKLCIDGTSVLLAELPDIPLVPEMYETLHRLNSKVRLLIAHVDRYNSGVVENLIEAEYLCQVNATSVANFASRKVCMDLFNRGCVFALGTDIHADNEKYYINMQKCLSKIGDTHYKVVQERMKKLLDGGYDAR